MPAPDVGRTIDGDVFLRVAYVLGDFQDAITAARRSPDTALTKLFLAMSLARVGRDAESEEVVRMLRRDHPDFDPMSVCELTLVARRACPGGSTRGSPKN